MAKLQPDYINWTLRLNAGDLEKEMQSIRSNTKELKEENQGLKKAMHELAMQGKINGKEYNVLDERVKANNRSISENNAKLKQCESQLSNVNKSYAQLSRQAKQLQRDLNNTVKSLHPEEYARLEKELNATRAAMVNLKETTDQAKGSFFSLSNTKALILGFFASIGAKIGSFFTDKIREAREFIDTGLEMAISADGVIRAFEKLNKPGLLDELNESTKGTVNNLELMKNAVQAHHFKIPLEDLAKYLKFAQMRAQETGLSVEYMTNSIVTGLGRKSLLILDNLGLSAAEINAEIGKTGDFMKAVASIVDNELSKAGETYISQADIAAKMTVELQNRQLELGRLLLPLKSKWDTFSQSIKMAVSGMAVDVAKSLQSPNDRFQEQLNKVVELQTTLPDLVSRYDSLQSKINRTATEQSELNKTMAAIAQIMPGAIEQTDQYGNILSINTNRIWEYLEAEQARLKYMNKDAITQAKKDIEKAEETLKNFQKRADTGKMYAERTMGAVPRDLTADEHAHYRGLVSQAQATISGAREQIKQLSGESLKEQVKARVEMNKQRQAFNAMDKKTLDEWIKNEKNATNQYLQLAKSIYEARFPKIEKQDKKGLYKSEMDKELAQLEIKHDLIILKIKEQRAKEELTEAQYNQIILQEDERYYTERLAKLNELEKRTAHTKAKTRDEILKKTIETNTNLLDTQRRSDENEIRLFQELRDKRLEAQDELYKNQKITLDLQYARQLLSKQAYELQVNAIEELNTRNRLQILKDYHSDVQDMEVNFGKVKADAVKQAGKAVIDAELANSKDQAKLQKTLDSLLPDFKKEFNLTNLPDETDLQLKVLEASYQARKELAEQHEKDTTELTKAYETAKVNIIRDAEARKFGIQEKYGLQNWNGRLKMQLDALKREKDQGLIEGEDYARAEKNLKMKAWKEAFDYYSNLFGDAVQALQNAEIANMEAKYDVEIEAARGNAQEVERLEQEKAEKKLEIEKKYADVQFAVKASQIIVNTAMAITTALAQLGPIAGPIAAALMGVTGAAQLAAANAERQKVKNMTLSGSSSTSSGERVVNGSGFSEGGYTGDGHRYEVAGVVHRGEYVVPMPEMQDKRVINAVKVIEAVRRNRTGVNPLPGYAEGGYVDRSNKVSGVGSGAERELKEASENLLRASERLGVPQRSYVVLNDIDAAQEMRDRFDKPFKRGDKNGSNN